VFFFVFFSHFFLTVRKKSKISNPTINYNQSIWITGQQSINVFKTESDRPVWSIGLEIRPVTDLDNLVKLLVQEAWKKLPEKVWSRKIRELKPFFFTQLEPVLGTGRLGFVLLFRKMLNSAFRTLIKKVT
jgi:hypothetical protein